MDILSAGRLVSTEPSIWHVERLTDRPLRLTGWLLGTGKTESVERNGDMTVTRVRLFRTVSGAHLWSWDRYSKFSVDEGTEPTREQLQRADVSVIRANGYKRDENGHRIIVVGNDEVDPAIAVELAWEGRPLENARISEAAASAWSQGARIDPLIAAASTEEIE